MINCGNEIQCLEVKDNDFVNNPGAYRVCIGNQYFVFNNITSGRELKDRLMNMGFNERTRCDILGPIEKMSEAEKEEQRRSFSYGNVAIGNSKVTRDLVNKVAGEMR